MDMKYTTVNKFVKIKDISENIKEFTVFLVSNHPNE